jgi:hypothetical protein
MNSPNTKRHISTKFKHPIKQQITNRNQLGTITQQTVKPKQNSSNKLEAVLKSTKSRELTRYRVKREKDQKTEIAVTSPVIRNENGELVQRMRRVKLEEQKP